MKEMMRKILKYYCSIIIIRVPSQSKIGLNLYFTKTDLKRIKI